MLRRGVHPGSVPRYVTSCPRLWFWGCLCARNTNFLDYFFRGHPTFHTPFGLSFLPSLPWTVTHLIEGEQNPSVDSIPIRAVRVSSCREWPELLTWLFPWGQVSVVSLKYQTIYWFRLDWFNLWMTLFVVRRLLMLSCVVDMLYFECYRSYIRFWCTKFLVL